MFDIRLIFECLSLMVCLFTYLIVSIWVFWLYFHQNKLLLRFDTFIFTIHCLSIFALIWSVGLTTFWEVISWYWAILFEFYSMDRSNSRCFWCIKRILLFSLICLTARHQTRYLAIVVQFIFSLIFVILLWLDIWVTINSRFILEFLRHFEFQICKFDVPNHSFRLLAIITRWLRPS